MCQLVIVLGKALFAVRELLRKLPYMAGIRRHRNHSSKETHLKGYKPRTIANKPRSLTPSKRKRGRNRGRTRQSENNKTRQNGMKTKKQQIIPSRKQINENDENQALCVREQKSLHISRWPHPPASPSQPHSSLQLQSRPSGIFSPHSFGFYEYIHFN